MTMTEASVRGCDMKRDCPAPITMLDKQGYAYCTDHGLDRRASQPCRKLSPSEIRLIQRGEQIARY